MQQQKEKVDSGIANADVDRGTVILLTGNGKGKSSSALGMVLRCLGHGFKVAIAQFIKGTYVTGENEFLSKLDDQVEIHQMGTGFTWETQDKSVDIAAAKKLWTKVEGMLRNESLYLVVLDELTYMIAYGYLEEELIVEAIRQRPENQTVVITGRGGGSKLRDLADTVSEIKSVKHAYQAGIKARNGIDL
jgi:cob(I)alamin adenosyltransferase|tara:strand:- start:115 stop:684 length:570 start_codon:yes stop_codon:yes gene_type:complete